MPKISSRRVLAAVSLAGALALAATGCGSSSKKTAAPATPTSTPAAPSDQVSVIANLTGVGTSVTLNPTTAAALTKLGVSVAPYGTAQASKTAAGTTVTFPITSGYAEIHSDHSYKPGWIIGSVNHIGSGLTFSGGGKSVSVKNFIVDPGNSMLYATVGTTQDIPLLYLDGSQVSESVQGGNVVLNGTVAELTATAAKTLNTEFGTQALKAGTPVGTVHLVAHGAITSYNENTDKTALVSRAGGQTTSVQLNPTTAAALTKLGVAVAPSGTGTFDKATSTVGFPITGGVGVIHTNKGAQPGYVDGVLLHQSSGLTFTKGSTQVALDGFIVDPGDSTLTATVGGMQNVPIANLNGSNLQISTPTGSVHLDGTQVLLTATAAKALDQAFGTTAITPGLDLGTAHIILTPASPSQGVNS